MKEVSTEDKQALADAAAHIRASMNAISAIAEKAQSDIVAEVAKAKVQQDFAREIIGKVIEQVSAHHDTLESERDQDRYFDWMMTLDWVQQELAATVSISFDYDDFYNAGNVSSLKDIVEWIEERVPLSHTSPKIRRAD